jgi:dolichyl-phosphate beta-glucosyltransferase
MTSGRETLSVIVPAYNEAARIEAPLRRMCAYFAAQPYACEILVVDDGSDDDTSALVRRVAESAPVPVRALRYARNRGKGHALKVGFEAARGERILFSDADLSTPIEETEAFLLALDQGFDVAIGTRKHARARITLRQPRHREAMGRVFTWLVRRLLADVSDATCGFKAFRGPAGRDLFARVRIPDWGFDAELLMLVRRLGYRLTEVPVQWQDREGTKVRLLRDALRSGLALVRIAAGAALGVYERPTPSGVRLLADPER